MLVNKYVEYPKPDHDDASREAVLPGTECKEQALPNGRSPLQAVQFCPLPGQVRHVKWWLTKYFADHADVFHLWAEMGNDECTGVKLKFQDSQNHSVYIPTPKVGRTVLEISAVNHAAITQMFGVLNEQWQA